MVQFGENIFNEGGAPVKIMWPIKMCLNETFAKFINAEFLILTIRKKMTLSRYVPQNFEK
jgi:hypothetical protein